MIECKTPVVRGEHSIHNRSATLGLKETGVQKQTRAIWFECLKQLCIVPSTVVSKGADKVQDERTAE